MTELNFRSFINNLLIYIFLFVPVEKSIEIRNSYGMMFTN